MCDPGAEIPQKEKEADIHCEQEHPLTFGVYAQYLATFVTFSCEVSGEVRLLGKFVTFLDYSIPIFQVERLLHS